MSSPHEGINRRIVAIYWVRCTIYVHSVYIYIISHYIYITATTKSSKAFGSIVGSQNSQKLAHYFFKTIYRNCVEKHFNNEAEIHPTNQKLIKLQSSRNLQGTERYPAICWRSFHQSDRHVSVVQWHRPRGVRPGR